MKLLFLRGQVPSDRPKEQIMFDRLADCDDMWSQLASEICRGGYGEIWYEKGSRVTRYTNDFVERWVPRYRTSKISFSPNVVFARGGFPYMLAEAVKYADAFKIHYGAGQRIVPKKGQPWDLVLVDTVEQLDRAQRNGYHAELFIKPAADNIFKPKKMQRKYDIIHVANFNPNANKGHRFLFRRLKSYKVLQVGTPRPRWEHKWPNVNFRGWMPRKSLPALYGMAKIAVVVTMGKDSCPRVISEALACDCPVLVNVTTQLWYDKYITPETGRITCKATFEDDVAQMLKDWESFNAGAYYRRELSMSVAAARVRGLIRF